MAPASRYVRLLSLNKEPYPLRLTRQQALSSRLSFNKNSILERDLADCHLLESMALASIANHEHGHKKLGVQTLETK